MATIVTEKRFFSRAKFVQLYGIRYSKGNIVISGHELMPHFLKLDEIYVLPNKDVIFWCKKVYTIRFSRHLWSYEIMMVNQDVLTSYYEELVDHHPLDCYCLNINGVSKTFVRMK